MQFIDSGKRFALECDNHVSFPQVGIEAAVSLIPLEALAPATVVGLCRQRVPMKILDDPGATPR